jgi:Fuc2NAc and GlcNAc transferase
MQVQTAEPHMLEFFSVPFIFLFAVAATDMAKSHASRSRLLALPTHRSSHQVSTPVGGGIAIVLAYLVTLGVLTLTSRLEYLQAFMLAASLPVAIVGYLDDRQQLDAGFRLAVQLACALVAVYLAGTIPAFTVGQLAIAGVWLKWFLLPLSLVWLCNLYNFMDGIDGLAGSEAAFVCLAAAVLLVQRNDLPLAWLCLGLFSGAAGFLVWNWGPARIFMGDVGSGFLGLTLGLVALVAHQHGTMSLWSWVILLTCFIVDATFTLVRRLLRGEKVTQAHRQHAYQHAAIRLASHRAVCLVVLAVNIVWLFPLAALASRHPDHGVYFAALAIVPLVMLAYRFDAGRESL